MASMDGFDPSKIADQTVVPEGTYAGIVISSKIEPTKSGGSQYIFTIKITEGQHAGQILTWRIHRTVANPVAKEIADRELKKLCVATIGTRKPNDTVDLHNITALFKVSLEPRKDNGEMVNQIKGVSPVNAQTAAKPAIPHPSQQSWNQAPVPPAAAGAPAPWSKPSTPTA